MSRFLILGLLAALACDIGATGPRHPGPASIDILEPTLFSVQLFDTLYLSANVFDSSGVNINEHVRIAWSSDDTNIVKVNQSGVLTAPNVGVSTIHAVVDADGVRVQDSIEVDVFTGTVVDRARPPAAPPFPHAKRMTHGANR